MLTRIVSGILIYALAITQVVAQTAALLPNAKQTFLGTTGAPLAAGTVTLYTPNSTNKKTTWVDPNQASANTNPVVLDAAGRAVIFGQGNYRQVVKDKNGVTIWDAFTSAYGSASPSGSSGTDTAPVGTVMPYSGFTIPTNWALAYGQPLNRATYASLLTAITISNTAVSCTATSTTLTGFSSTAQFSVGEPIEATCLAANTTISSITNSTTIVVSAAAISSATITAVVFPWGNGDGNSTFNVPDLRGRTFAGADAMGGTAAGRLSPTYYGASAAAPGISGGAQSTTLLTQNLPPYTPTGTVTTALTPNAFVVPSILTVQSGSGSTSNSNSSSTLTATSTFIGSAQGGTSTPFGTVQPTVTVNYIIKVAPNSSGAGGVVSIGGMFGDIICDATFLCANQTIGLAIPVTVPSGGTGQTSFTAGLPIIGVGASALTSATKSGNTTSFATTAGTLPNGNCVSIDSSGNLINAGGPCTTGGGGGTVTAGTINQLAYYPSSSPTVAGTSAIPNGITATTQAPSDSSTKVATDAFVQKNILGIVYNAQTYGWLCDSTDHSTEALALITTVSNAGGGTIYFPTCAATTFTGSISTTTLIVTAASSGTNITVGQQVLGASAGTKITALGSGTGGTGTYAVNNSQTLTSRQLTSIFTYRADSQLTFPILYTLPSFIGTQANITLKGAAGGANWDNITLNSGPFLVNSNAAVLDLRYQGEAAAAKAFVITGGAGYTNGIQTLTIVAPGCSVAPQYSVTVSGNAVTAPPTLVTAGTCTSTPSNPVATTGGGGTGATLNVYYTGGKILTKGGGVLNIEGLGFIDGGTSNSTPFIYTTNTAIKVKHNTFICTGNVEQDVAVFGGTLGSGHFVEMSNDSPFNGYGTILEDNVLSNCNRMGFARSFANGIIMLNNSVQAAATGARTFFESIGFNGGGTDQHTITGNQIEVSNYKYGLVLNASHNGTYNNEMYDFTGGFLSAYFYDTSGNLGVSAGNQITSNTGGVALLDSTGIFPPFGGTVFDSSGNGNFFSPALPAVSVYSAAFPFGVMINGLCRPDLSRNPPGGLTITDSGNGGAGLFNLCINSVAGFVDIDSTTANGASAGQPIRISGHSAPIYLGGQIISTYGTPTIASGACGSTTNGVITSGKNQSGLVTIGAAMTTTCTISFSATLAAVPNGCRITPASAGAADQNTTRAYVDPASLTTTSWAIKGAALASTAYYYDCW